MVILTEISLVTELLMLNEQFAICEDVETVILNRLQTRDSQVCSHER